MRVNIFDFFCAPVCDEAVPDSLVHFAYHAHFRLEQKVINFTYTSLYRVFYRDYNIVSIAVFCRVKHILKRFFRRQICPREVLEGRHFAVSSSFTLEGNPCHTITCPLCGSAGMPPCRSRASACDLRMLRTLRILSCARWSERCRRRT